MKQKLFLAFAMLMTFCSFCWADDEFFVVAEIDWTQQTDYYNNDVWYDNKFATLVVSANGLEITSNPPENAVYYWDSQVPIIAHIPDLEKGKNYQVKFTLEAPTSGKIQLDLCSWDGTEASMAQVIDVIEGLHEYTVSFNSYPTSCTNAMIFYECGLIPGKHIIKNVQIREVQDEAYAVLSEDGTTLTFYFDGLRATHTEGTAYPLNTGSSNPGWYKEFYNYEENPNKITTVEFTSDFKYARPTSTYYWFAHQENLMMITGFSNLNTSEVTNMRGMFYGCKSLTSLNLSSFNTDKVTNMSWMFCECTSLTSLNLSSLNTSEVTDMSYMFVNCSSLTSLNLRNFDTSNVKYMNSMFSGCRSLPSLDVSSFDTGKVTEMNEMFSGCRSLTSLDLSGFNTSMVTKMNYMFTNSSSLTSLDLSCFNTSKVTTMKWMFKNDNSLTTIYVGSHWDTSNLVSNGGDEMFSYCSSLVGGNGTTYDSNNTDDEYAHIDGVGGKGYLTAAPVEAYAMLSSDGTTLTFCYDAQMTTRTGGTVYALNTGSNDPGWYKTYSGSGENPNKISKVVIHSAFKDVRPTSTYEWFSDQENLTTITGIDNLNTSEVTNMNYMFYHCSSLPSLDLRSFNTSNATYMRHVFNGCSGLTSLDVSGFNTSKVEDMSYMFAECSSLPSLDVSGFNTSEVTDMSSMFFRCRSLPSLDVSRFDTSKVKYMNSMFSGCGGLTSLDVSNFNTSEVTNMLDMFDGCIGLTSLDLSSFNTSKVTNMSWMFYYAKSLTTIYVGSQWTTSNLSSDGGNNMFTGCTNLIGGNGTTYNSNNTDDEYAHIDGVGGKGYLSSKPDNGITTALETLPQDKVQNSKFKVQSDSWYTIDGRKINGKPNTKGIYVKNGRKVVL